MDMEAAQIALEKEMHDAGLRQFMASWDRAMEAGQASLTHGGRNAVRQLLEPVTQELEKWLKEAKSGKPGRRHSALPVLEGLDPRVSVWLALNIAIDNCIRRVSIQSIAIKIGRRLEVEAGLIKYEEEKPQSFGLATKILKRDLKATPSKKIRLFKRSAEINNVGFSNFGRTYLLHAGMVLLDILINKTGLFEQTSIANKTIQLHPSAALLQFFEETKESYGALFPPQWPMLVPPLDWSKDARGGYFTTHRPLVKESSRSGKSKTKLVRDMPKVYEAVNKMQRTSFKVNARILDIVKAALDARIPIKGFPSPHDRPIPPMPTGIIAGPVFRSVKRAQNEARNANFRTRSQRASVRRTVKMAERFAVHDKIYFPVELDSRGRAYYRVTGLSPQGSDLGKGLVEFATGVPLGERGVWWLQVHTANVFGHDKIKLEYRVAWTQANEPMILSIAEDPFKDLRWTTADKPIQFLAACLHYAEYKKIGPSYSCPLIVMIDGTCSGIQHYAAMTRDDIAGRKVNLVPLDEPEDIYKDVAEESMRLLRKDLNSTEEIVKETRTGARRIRVRDMAEFWISYGITRKATKRPTMVLPYGGTMNACARYLVEHVTEDPSIMTTLGDSFGIYVGYLSKIVWTAMLNRIGRPLQTMAWLRSYARVLVKRDGFITWSTPSGFIVRQVYKCLKRRRLKTKLGDTLVYLSVSETDDEPDYKKSITAFPPNFVHSFDAALLALTLAVLPVEVTHVVTVHDCYGTHAAHMDLMGQAVRQIFVEMYTPDVLEQFAQAHPTDPEVTERPPKGSLCLPDVVDSPYFCI